MIQTIYFRKKSKTHKQIVKGIFNSRFKFGDDIKLSLIYDLIGDLIREDSEFFMEKTYNFLYKNIKKTFSYEQIIDMEKSILVKYCFEL